MARTNTDVGHLVDMITGGQLRLPELQRRYVWPATRVRDLFDSLYRGYPSGSILVWETDQEVPTHDLAIRQTASAFTPMLLLDGQQRLTSLASVIRGEPVRVKHRLKPIEIAFNLEHPDRPYEVLEVEGDEPSPSEEGESEDGDEENGAGPISILERLKHRTFVVASNALRGDKQWILVSDIFKKTDWQLLKPLGITPDDAKYELYSERLQRVRQIKNYQYAMEVLPRNTAYEEVAEIFVRVNSLGMKLRGSDLALAQITSRWQTSLKLFDKFAEECEEVWFTFDLGILVRTLVVFATHQCRFRTVANIPIDKLQTAWEEAKDGIRFAVNFLRANAGVEDESLLSSPFLVIPVAVLGILSKEKLSKKQEKDLLHWLFVANARGHYSGNSETTLDADLAILFRGGEPSELLEIIRQKFGRMRFDAADFAGRSWRNPLFAVTYLALKASGAKDWHSGLAVSLSHQGRNHYLEAHHIFPKSVLNAAHVDNANINEIANLAFVSGKKNRSIGKKPPETYFPGIVESRGVEALSAQAVPLNHELWEVDNFSSFLDWRRSELANVVNRFLDELCKEGKVRMSLSSLVSEEESQILEFKASARYNEQSGSVDARIEQAICKAIAGFMNAAGGTLLIGVNDRGLSVGIEHDLKTLKKPTRDDFQLFLMELVSTNLGKNRCNNVSVGFETLEGHEVCVVTVSPSPKPVYLKEGSAFFVRTGNSTKPFSMEEAVEYISDRWRT